MNKLNLIFKSLIEKRIEKLVEENKFPKSFAKEEAIRSLKKEGYIPQDFIEC